MNFFPEIAKYSLLVSVLASFFIVKKADKTWLPFFLFLYAGIITEFISTYLQKNGRSNAVITNIYAIVEILLIIWLFHNWSLFRSKKISVLFGGIFILAFITENFIINKPHSFNLYFNILSSMAIVIMSILNMNKIIITETKALIKNPAFLTCVAFIIYFTYLALVEIFYIYGLSKDITFSVKMYAIMTAINLFTNLTYAMVILWIPRKRYSLL